MQDPRAKSRERVRQWKRNNPEAAKRAADRAHKKLMRDPVRLAKKRKYARAHQRKWRLENPEKHADVRFRSMYGLSVKEYRALLSEQNGLCAICKKPETSICKKTSKPYALSVDHCHKTGKVRGLLCSRCNRGLGYLQHDAVVLVNATAYLIKNA